MISYPRDIEARYVLYKISTGQILEYDISYPDPHGGEIKRLSDDLVYLELREDDDTPYDPVFYERQVNHTALLDDGVYQVSRSTQRRSDAGIRSAVEVIEDQHNKQIIPTSRQLKTLLLGVGVALKAIDPSSLSAKESAVRTEVLDLAIKVFKNDDRLKAIISDMANDPDTDTGWES